MSCCQTDNKLCLKIYPTCEFYIETCIVNSWNFDEKQLYMSRSKQKAQNLNLSRQEDKIMSLFVIVTGTFK